jgi:hypothetical protein
MKVLRAQNNRSETKVMNMIFSNITFKEFFIHNLFMRTVLCTNYCAWDGYREAAKPLARLSALNQSDKIAFFCMVMYLWVFYRWVACVVFFSSICGTLHSVDQYLNIKLTDISVTDPDKYPHMVSKFVMLVRSYCISYILYVASYCIYYILCVPRYCIHCILCT